MATQVASLFGLISLKDEMTPGLEKAKGGLTSFTDGLKNVGQQLTGFGVSMTALGAPFLGVAVKAQQAFDEMDDAADQLGAVLTSTGGAAGMTRQELLKMGKDLQDLSGINRAAIVTGENMLLTFTNIGSTVFPRATKATLDLSVAMKGSMKDSAIQLGKALNDPINGITALTRVGVTFTDQQKEMIAQMQNAGDIAGAQGIVLAEIEREFGGSAAAAADPIDHLGTVLNDLAIDVGVALQPVLESVIPVVQDFVSNLSQFLTAMSDRGDNTVGIILAIGAGLAILGPIIAAIGIGITALAGIFAVVFSPVGLIIAGIIAAVLWMQATWGDLFQAVAAGVPIVDILRVILFRLLPEDVATGIVTAIGNITTFLSGLVTGIIDFVTHHSEVVLAFGAVAMIIAIVSTVASVLTTAVGLLTAALGLLFSPVVILAVALGALVYVASTSYPGGLSKLFSDAATSAQQLAAIFTGILLSAVNSITEKINNFITAVSGISGIIQLLTSGQVTPGQVIGAIGNEISGSGGSGAGNAANIIGGGISNSSRMTGGSRGFGGGDGLTINGPVTVNANNTAEFEQEFNNRYRGRG